MIYVLILLGVIAGAIAIAVGSRLIGKSGNVGIKGPEIDFGKYIPQFKMIGTVMLLIFVLAILFPDSRPLFFGDPKILLAFFGVLGIFFLNFSLGGSQTVTNLIKVFAWGVIAYIVFQVLVAPYVNFDSIGEKITDEKERLEQSLDKNEKSEGGIIRSSPSSSRVEPHTQTSPVKISPEGRLEFVKVSIDGTNEFDAYPLGQRKGHDTTLVLNPGECVEVTRVYGWLSYMSQDQSGEWKVERPPVYGAATWDAIQEEYTAFYPYENSLYGVLVVLWQGETYKVYPLLQPNETIARCNPFAEPTRVHLFFNTPETLRNRVTGITEDMFSFNGRDGSRAVFDVKLCEETANELTSRWDECGR